MAQSTPPPFESQLDPCKEGSELVKRHAKRQVLTILGSPRISLKIHISCVAIMALYIQRSFNPLQEIQR